MAYTAANLQTFFTNANAGVAPSDAQKLTLQALSNQNAAGTLTDAQALAQTIDLASDITTAVSVETYAFFTGVAPSQDGLKFLNAAFTGTGAQAGLNGENRFIAQSVALALGNTAAKTSFSASYGSLSVADATKAAYNIIIGNAAAAAAGINVDAAVSFLTSATSVAYYTNYVKANLPATTSAADLDLAVKAAIVGEIMYLATTFNNGAGVGSYATAANNLIKDLADDGALTANNTAGINLFTAYGSTGSGTPGTPGSILALTVNPDAITGTANDDTITGVVTGTAGAPTGTLNFGDVINGGLGNDTLAISSNATGGVAISGLQLTSVETVSVNNTLTGGADTVSLNAAGLTGVTAIVSSGQGSLTVTNAGSTGVGFRDVAIAATTAATVTAAAASNVNVSGVTIAAGGSASIDVSGLNAAVGGTVNLVNTGKAATITTLTLGATDTVKATTLAVNAGANITVGTLATGKVGDLTKVTVGGAGAFTVTNAIADSTLISSIDASTNTGGVSLSLASAAALTSLKGGAGADTFTLATGLINGAVVDLGAGNDTFILGGVSGTGATINGGDGTDTLGITAAAQFTAGTKAAYTGFEVAQIGNDTYDTTLFTGFSQINVGTGTTVLQNVAANATFTVAGASTSLDVQLGSTGGTTDNVNLNLGLAGKSSAAIALYKAAGVETLTINSINGNAASATTLTANALKLNTGNDALTNVVVSGNGFFQLDTTNAAKALNVNATALTSFLEVKGGSASVLNVIGSNQNDSITAGTVGGSINAGKGGDLITTGNGVDVIVLKAGDSSLELTTATAGVNQKGTMDQIAGFTTGSDKIDLTQIAGFVGSAQGVASATATDVASVNTLLATANVFKDAGSGLTRGVLDITATAGHYVAVDVNHDGSFTAGTDLVVLVTGLAGGASLVATDFNFGS